MGRPGKGEGPLWAQATIASATLLPACTKDMSESVYGHVVADSKFRLAAAMVDGRRHDRPSHPG